ncbi:MAG: serine/threonine-protein kinase [Planctomycetota bacterium]
MVELGTDGLLYRAFRVVRQLGRGSQARILMVQGDRQARGFKEFLASAVAWQELGTHGQVVPLRQRIQELNRGVHELLAEEADHMDAGNEPLAAEIRSQVAAARATINAVVADLQVKQQHYIGRRSMILLDASIEAMIEHCAKLGIPYPADDVFALKQATMHGEEHRLRLRDEFRSLKIVQHPNIVFVFAPDEDHYVMEYAGGTVPADAIIAGPRSAGFTNAERIGLVVEVAKAVEHAHQFGVVHRDIKPDNIAVGEAGGVKLIDFGIAKSAESAGLTRIDTAMGTPHFMSPEQIVSAAAAVPSFDIYALGATLYHYVSGARPYDQARHQRTGRTKVTTGTQDVFITVCDPDYLPLPPSAVAAGIPAVLDEIIMKALAKEANRRYQSVHEFREDLERYLVLADGGTLTAGSFFGVAADEVHMHVRRRGRTAAAPAAPQSTWLPAARAPLARLRWILGGVAAALVLVITVLLLRAGGPAPAAAAPVAAVQPAEEYMRGLFEMAEDGFRRDPSAYRKAVEDFSHVIRESRRTGVTRYEQLAAERAQTVGALWRAERGRVMTELAYQAQNLLMQNDVPGALRVYEGYQGPLADEVPVMCAEDIENLRKRQRVQLYRQREQPAAPAVTAVSPELVPPAPRVQDAESQAMAAARARVLPEVPGIIRTVVEYLGQRKPQAAADYINAKIKDGPFVLVGEELEPARRTAEAAAAVNRQSLRYLQKYGDRTLSLELVNGKVVAGRIAAVIGEKLVFMVRMEAEDGASLPRDIYLKDISLAFRMRELKLKPWEDPDLAMALYFEADAQGEKSTRDRMRGWAGDHQLLKFIDAAPIGGGP